MGNTHTREARPSLTPPRRRSRQWSTSADGRSPYEEREQPEGSRSARGSRPDLSLLGLLGGSDRNREQDVASLERRRETKQEREARRLEKERAARLKERERSMREEHVDGGYLVTQGVYVGLEDFNKAVVRQLMIERRLAPFWRGLNEFSDSWAEHQLMAAARGMPIPPADEIPPELECKFSPKTTEDEDRKSASTRSIQQLTVPISSRSQSFTSDGSGPASSLPSPTSPIASKPSTTPLFRSRAKTLASLTSSSRHGSQVDLTPREIQLPKDPFVNGQPIEAYLYKDATECPICFLYYPPYLNRTRCCDQPICSECFVQIKRPDPHPPEHGEPNQTTDTEPATTEGDGTSANQTEGQLVSEPSACPFCVQPEFGVTYAPPSFRRGLAYATDPSLRPTINVGSPLSSTSSLPSTVMTPTLGRRRATSLSTTDPSVVTTDKIRPDWAQKLANARAHAARRSAAATALHTAAYLMNANQSGGGGGSDTRTFSLGRRGVMRRAGMDSPSGGSGRSGSPALNALAFLTERRAAGQEAESAEEGTGNATQQPRSGSGSRRSRLDDLEEMMMMEAIRLSLASEEERRKREEKEAKKEAKRKEKEAKKAEKAARKGGGGGGLYSNNASMSALDGASDSRLGKVASSSSSIIAEDLASADKGKGIERVAPSAAPFPGEPSSTTTPSGRATLSSSSLPGGTMEQQQQKESVPPGPVPTASSEPVRRSHLRHVSSASSSFSSLVESTAGDHPGCGGGGGAGAGHTDRDGLEPMFNFRSLAAVIGDEEKRDEGGYGEVEHLEDTTMDVNGRPRAESSASVTPPMPTHASTVCGGVMGTKEMEADPMDTTPAATPTDHTATATASATATAVLSNGHEDAGPHS